MLPQTHTMYLPASSGARQPEPHGAEQTTCTETNNSSSDEQGQIVVIQAAPILFAAYNSKLGRKLGILQIAAGIVSVPAGITGVVLYSMALEAFFTPNCIIATGIWCGVFVSVPHVLYICTGMDINIFQTCADGQVLIIITYPRRNYPCMSKCLVHHRLSSFDSRSLH